MNTTIAIIFYIIFAIVGIICLYNGYDMKVNGNLRIGWFVGQDIKKERCKDVPGFIEATFKPIMIFGGTVVTLSIAMIIIEGVAGTESYTMKLIQLGLILVIMIIYFWFNRQITKATNKYLK